MAVRTPKAAKKMAYSGPVFAMGAAYRHGSIDGTVSFPYRAVSLLLVLLAPTLLGAAERAGEPAPTLRIVNARLIDGTGAPARRGSLRIAGERIVAVGEVAPIPGEQVLDAKGFVLAPGRGAAPSFSPRRRAEAGGRRHGRHLPLSLLAFVAHGALPAARLRESRGRPAGARRPISAPTASSTAGIRAVSVPIRASSDATCASAACCLSKRPCAR
jgi:hypothetical protein